MVAELGLYDQALADFRHQVETTRIKKNDEDGQRQLTEFLRDRARAEDAKDSIIALKNHAGQKYGAKRIDGKVVISQKWMDNILGNIDHAIAVGNKLMTGAPESVGMAWFVVKLGLSAIQSNYSLYSLFGSGLTSMTEMMILIPHYDKVHDQRSKPGFVMDDMTQKLFQDIIACYAAILDFLFSVKRHVEANVAGKVRHAVKDLFGSELKKFQDKQSNIMTLKAKVIEASDARFQGQMFEGMDDIQTSLKKSLDTFESKADELLATQSEILQSLQDMRSAFKPKSRWDHMKQDYDVNVKKLDPFESDTDVFPLLKKQQYPGTLTWLAEDVQLSKWTTAQKSSLLCISGPEGIGKSVAIASISDKLANATTDKPVTICRFSCTNEDNNFEDLGNSPADRIRHTLLYQLYSTLAISEEDVNKLEEANKVFLRPKMTERQQSVSNTNADKYIPAFTEALPKLAEIAERQFILIVDGLDRLDEEDEARLYEDFSVVLSDESVTIKFLAGCRNGSPFASKASTREQCLDMTARDGRLDDLNLVLDSALADLQGLTASEKQEAREKVLEKAGSSLAYIRTIAIPFLQEPFQRPLSRRLEALPETITDSFRQALNSMNPTYYDLLETALTWTLYSAQPVRAKEIMEAFSGIYLVDLDIDVGPEYERKLGYAISDLEAVQIQEAADRFLRIWSDKESYLGINQSHHYVDLIDAARVRSFCDSTNHSHDARDGHDHDLCHKCQRQQADQGHISLPEKEVHLRMAIRLLRHINSPLFQRRYGLINLDGTAIELEDAEPDPPVEDGGKQDGKADEIPEDDAVQNTTSETSKENGPTELGEAPPADDAIGTQPEVVNAEADEKEPEANGVAEADAGEKEPGANGVAEADAKDADDAASDGSDEEWEDENVYLGAKTSNKNREDVPYMNSVLWLPMRYEIEQWPFHAKRAEELFTAEEKAADPRWKELISELDKLALEHTHIFRRWWCRWARLDGGFARTEEQYMRNTMPQYRPLHVAARLGLTTWAHHLIHEKGFDTNEVLQDRTPMRAIEPAKANLSILEYFLNLPGADPFSFSSVGSVLHYWLYFHPSVETVKLFIKYGGNFKDLDPFNKETGLHVLARTVKDPEVMRLVLDSEPKPELEATEGDSDNTALLLLFLQNEVPEAVLDVMLEAGANVNAENKGSMRPLEMASWSIKPDMIKKILARGVDDIDDPDNQGRTALHNAVSSNSPESVRVLVDHKADINYADEFGDTPLHDAAACGFKDVIEILVDLGANLVPINKRTHTPFWKACNDDTRLEAATALLEAMQRQNIPVDIINTPSKSKRTPFRQACTNGLTTIVEKLIQLTKDAGQDVPAMLDMADSRGKATALHRAALRGQVECVRMLLDNGANPLLKDSKELTALKHASMQWQISSNPKFEDIVMLLAAKDVETAQDDEDLPATAAANGSIQVLKILSRLGADINRVDSMGWSPLSLAQKENRTEVVRFLKRHTAHRRTLPSRWIKHNAIGSELNMTEDGLSIEHNDDNRICLSTDRPLPAGLDRFYFEVTLNDTVSAKDTPFPIFALGFCTLGASAYWFPGWTAKPNAASGISWAYHGDDGWLASDFSSQHSDKFGPKDTVGCGVDLEERKIWFTRNGEKLEAEHSDVSGRLFPIIGLKDTVSVKTNFGSEEFKWHGFYEAHGEDTVAGAREDLKPVLERTMTV